MILSKKNLVSWPYQIIFIFNGVFIWSEIVKRYVSWNLIAPISLVILLAIILFEKRKIPIFCIYVASIVGFTQLLQYGFYGNTVSIAQLIYFLIGLITVCSLKNFELERISNIFSVIATILIFFSFTGLIYSKIGLPPLGFIERSGDNPQTLLIYPITLALETASGLRINSIYDEPGAFAFFLAITVFLRTKVGSNNNKSLLILIGGLPTMSLGLIFFLVIFLLFYISQKKHMGKVFLRIIYILILSVIFFLASNDLFSFDLIFHRIQRDFISEDANLNNNRFILFINALDYMKTKGFNWFFGIDYAFYESWRYGNFLGSGIGENPLSPLIFGGVLGSYIYYSSVFWLLYVSLKYRDFLAFGVFLFLLQRPYIFDMGYALLYLLVIRISTKNFYALLMKNKA